MKSPGPDSLGKAVQKLGSDVEPDRTWVNPKGATINYGYPQSTPWWKLVRRVIWARRRGLKIKLLIEVEGTWMYGGWRRG